MKIKSLLNKWKYSLLLNAIFLFYLAWLSNQVFDGIFGGIIELSIFFTIPILFYFIHSFYVLDFKTKIIAGLVDLFPLFLSQIIENIMNYNISISGIVIAYLVPIIVITFLSWGLTKAFMYIKFRANKK